MKIAVVDDIQFHRNLLINTLNEYVSKNGFIFYQIDEFESGEEFLKSFKKGNYDIIFLDIYMNELNGIETAKILRKQDIVVKLVFISSCNDYASESYSVQADYYLLKPFGETEIAQLFTRLDIIDSESKVMLTLPDGQSVLIQSILYTTFYGHYVTIHCKDEYIVKLRCTQGKFQDFMAPYQDFAIASKGIIVNFNSVDCINLDHFIMNNEKPIPISRRNYFLIKEAYSAFLIRNMRKGDNINASTLSYN